MIVIQFVTEKGVATIIQVVTKKRGHKNESSHKKKRGRDLMIQVVPMKRSYDNDLIHDQEKQSQQRSKLQPRKEVATRGKVAKKKKWL